MKSQYEMLELKHLMRKEGSRVVIVPVQVRAGKVLYTPSSSSSGGAQEKRKEGMKLSLAPKLVEKLVWVTSSLSYSKISFPVKHLMPYYAETGHSRPPIA
jgi:hypothetical protein